ncbi:S-adenosyl-L-methionine-dependent methyltransferase [Aspergillus karnatakaensis]|uniref:class I SAM-dependent methyltransferase n=1 Tax=Aspergillus karnatakaensis TaxID=1810916 RepID=UPI003CCD2D93
MSNDFAERNRQTFNQKSRTYRSEFPKVVETLISVVQGQRTWVSDVWSDTEAGKGKDIRLLEYACGPGHISLALAPYVSRVVGMDISDGMIEEFNKNVAEAGYSDTVTGIRTDILAESSSSPAEVSGPEYFDFDVVVVSMALHHFEHPKKALIRLSERLKEGGVLMIVDMIPEHHQDHGLHHTSEVVNTISKHGFSHEEMQTMYAAAGISIGFKFQVIEEQLEFHRDGNTFHKTIFIARGQK